MHQWVNWGEAKRLKLHELTQQPHLAVSHQLKRPLHRRTSCQALRRPTPAQRGSLYYENYMRKRREKGGVFLGPPLQLPAWQVQLTEEQQSVHQQLQETCDGPFQQQPEQPEGAQQQQQQHPCPDGSTASPNFSSYNTEPTTTSLPANRHLQKTAPASLDPVRFCQLLEESMLSTAPQPLGPSQMNPNPLLQHPLYPADTQQQQGLRAQPLQSPTPQQYQQQPRQAWQFKDYLAPELAEALLPTLKRKGGLSITPPKVQQGYPLVPLPELHSSTASQNDSSNPGASLADVDSASSSSSSSSSDSDSSAGGSSSRTRVLHVYWDISSAHPGGVDPRVIVAQLKRVLSSYGLVAGIYAYGLQKMFNWVPEAFMLQYAPERLPGGKQKRLALSRKQQQQQEELEQQLQAAVASGLDLDEMFGPLRCPCCGKLRANYQQLHLHMVQRHKQPAPPLIKLLPATALSTVATAAAGGSGQQPRQERQSLPVSTWIPSDVKSMMNNSTRTLGRVARYYNSQGALFVPPDSHQISLKYVLLREGVEVRLVQNHKHAVDVSLAEGLRLLLQQLLQRDAVSAQQYEDVVVVISDRGTHTQMLKRFQKAGFPVIAICRGIRRYLGADTTLRWQWVINGRYDC